MAIEKANGVVIRLGDYSETSQIATLVTDLAGKVSLIAKGSRRPASSIGGALDLLTVTEIVYSTGKSGGLAKLREAKASEHFPGIRRSVARYYAALYFAELAGIFGEGSEGSRDLYDLLVESLQALCEANEPSVGNIVLYFESHVLAVSGVSLNVETCARCGAHSEAALKAPRISLEDGGILCANCAGGLAVRPGSLAALRRVFQSNVASVQRLRLRHDLEREVSDLLSAAVVYACERVPRLLRYVKAPLDGSWRRWIARQGEGGQLDKGEDEIYNGSHVQNGG